MLLPNLRGQPRWLLLLLHRRAAACHNQFSVSTLHRAEVPGQHRSAPSAVPARSSS